MKLFPYLLSCVWFLFAGLMALSGQEYRLSNNIAVLDFGGKSLSQAWAGGNNNNQFSDIDLDFDGKKDMVIFNRDGATFTAYLNKGNTGEINYEYSPKYSAAFDSCNCTQWALLEDFNCDGREDVFCGYGAGENFQVYKNVVYGGDSIGFEVEASPLLSLSDTPKNMYQDRTDLPAIVDVDYDGDLDVITSQSGFNLFALHRNVSVEDYGNCDTLAYEKQSFCWGHFYEDNNTNALFVADTIFCPRGNGNAQGPSGSRHSGSSLLVLDTNADSLVDLMIGDISYSTANVLYNNGEIDHAFMDSVEYIYPQADSAIDVFLFPGFFHLDVDNDNIRDLVVSSNESLIGENVHGSVLYLNHGLDNHVDFRFSGRGFMTSDQIDVGFRSVPEFFDYNNDGLKDLLVGGGAAYVRDGDTTVMQKQFHLFENVGTSDVPVFELIDSTYLDLENLPIPIFNASPAFGDLDGDGDDDMIIGNVQGTLIYFQNIAAPNSPANFSLANDFFLRDINGDSIDVGSHSAPELVDIDNDGDLDVFVGEIFGNITFFQNNGDAMQPQFAEVTDEWGFVKVTNAFGSLFSGHAKPEFFDYDKDGELELLVGAESGEIIVYDDLSNALTDTLQPSGAFMDYDAGEYAAPELAIIDSSGNPTMIVGNGRGGLLQFDFIRPKDTMQVSTFEPKDIEPSYKLFPNPSSGRFFVEFNEASQMQGQHEALIFNSVGQLVSKAQSGNARMTIDLSGLSQGIYYAKIKIRTGVYRTEKLVFTK